MSQTQEPIQITLSDENAKDTPSICLEEAIEAVLFAAGHALTYEQLAKVFDISKKDAKARVMEYAELYNHAPIPRGVILLTYDDSCQLSTKAEFISYIRDALGIRKNGNLSNSSIEALAIVAYNQPVTRAYIDTVRGVDSSYAVSNLLERGLLECKGRLDAPGRPMLYGTSENFLRCFGLSSLAELPGVNSEEAEEILSRIAEQLSDTPDKNQITLDASIDEVMIPSEEGDTSISDESV